MPGFTVFDAETGEVVRSGICAAGDLHLQPQVATEIVIEGAYSDAEFTIAVTENGVSPRKRRRRLTYTPQSSPGRIGA